MSEKRDSSRKVESAPPGVPRLDASGGGTGNVGRAGCEVPQATRKGRNPKKTASAGTRSSSRSYAKLSDVPAQFRSVSPLAGGVAVKLSLSQANKLAEIYRDIISSGSAIKNPVEAAKVRFRQQHLVRGGKWVVKQESKAKLNELWASVPGSYEEDQALVRDALRGSSEFGQIREDWDLSIEATFADKVIVRNSTGDGTVYYQASWTKDDDGSISFSDIEKIQAEVAFKTISEQKELIAEVRRETKTVDLNEVILTPIRLTEQKVDGKTVHKGSVEIAQKAGTKDDLNENRRFYPANVLKEAVADAQMRIQKNGPLLMDSVHRVERDEDGQLRNVRSLRETVALIHDLNWHQDKGTVSLDEITFVDTQAGKDIVAVLERGARLQVSQRAVGTAERYVENGNLYEEVTSLKLNGWDFVPGGEASVVEADFDFRVVTEGKDMAEKVLGADGVKSLIQEAIPDIAKTAADTVISALKESGLIKEEEDRKPDDDEDVEDEASESSSEEKESSSEDEEGEDASDTPSAETSELKTEVKQLRKVVDESKRQMDEMTQQKELNDLRSMGTEILEEHLASDDFSRFDDDQKKIILERVDPTRIYGSVDHTDRDAVAEALKPYVLDEVNYLDRIVASRKLKNLGYPARGKGGTGITHVEIVNENVPNMEYISQLTKDVKSIMESRSPANAWQMPDDHPSILTLNEVMAGFDRQYYRRLLLESNEEVTGSDIGVKVASISRVLIPVAWRALTALSVCTTASLANLVDNVMVTSWNPAETADIADDYDAMAPGESGTIATAGVQYTACPVVAVERKIRTYVTALARATAKNTPIRPEADAVAGLAQAIQRTIDRFLWQLMITAAHMQSYTQVTSFTALTEGTNDEWLTGHAGLLQYEILKSYDANGNPTASKLGKLYAGPSGNTLQDLEVQEAGDDNTDLVYETDYSVDWAEGTITLTSAGKTKEAGNGLQAKYTYTSNIKTWSKVPPSSYQLYDWLINLRQQVGAAKVLVGNRQYTPNFLGMSLETEDLITSGPQFEWGSSRPSDVLDRLNNILAFAGLTPVKTSAMPQAYILIGEKGACVHGVHTPWMVDGPIRTTTDSHNYYVANEFSGDEVPVKDKLAVVGITNI